MSRIALLIIVLLTAGCKEVLYTDIPERDINMMIAILEKSGIPADRKKQEEKGYSLLVEVSDFTKAVNLLSAKGYPRSQFQSIGDVFGDDALVKTPFEQRARYTHALNQELARSISGIDGVVSARVHIVVPERSRFGRKLEEPRAAVFIHYNRETSLHNLKPKIKKLVAHSVSGLAYEKVAVAMIPVNVSAGLSIPPKNEIDQNQVRFNGSNISETSHKIRNIATVESNLEPDSLSYQMIAFLFFAISGVFATVAFFISSKTLIKK